MRVFIGCCPCTIKGQTHRQRQITWLFPCPQKSRKSLKQLDSFLCSLFSYRYTEMSKRGNFNISDPLHNLWPTNFVLTIL